jgi:hypothetical protein
MDHTRRAALLSLMVSPLRASPQGPDIIHLPPPMPTGGGHAKSKEQIAEENREAVLKDVEELVRTSVLLRDELKSAGEYVVPIASVKRTKEIEKLARRIRALLKG